jgi:Golgi-body localization protein
LDIDQFTLKLPTFEYNEKTWSWLDFTLQLRRDAIRVVWGNIGALVREKFRQFGMPNEPETEPSERATPMSVPEAREDREEERKRLMRQRQDAKARLLLGKAYRPRREEGEG